jgi:hypothetical protein
MEKKNERGRELREGDARRPVTFWRRWGGYGGVLAVVGDGECRCWSVPRVRDRGAMVLVRRSGGLGLDFN